MAFSQKDFFDLGILLKDKPFEEKLEASFRTSISRIYYSIFLLINNELNKNYPNKIKKSNTNIRGNFGVHQQIINYLLNDMNTRESKIGNWLQDLKRLREKADYDLSSTIRKDDIIEAKRIHDKILFELGEVNWCYIP